MPTRLLVVTPWGIGTAYGGPPVLMDRLFSRLPSSFVVDVLYTDTDEGFRPKWAHMCHRAMPRSARFGRIDQLRWIIRSCLFVARHRADYDVVHIHGLYMANVPAAMLAKSLRMLVIALPVLENGDLKDAQQTGGLRHWASRLKRRAVMRIDVGLALSAGIRDEFERAGLDPDHIAEMGNPVDTTAFRPRSKSASGPFTVGFIGKVGRKKGADLIVAAIKSIQHEFPVRALLVGPIESAEFASALDKMSQGVAVEHTGYVRDVAAHVDQMDVFVLPSQMEGLPGALVEAMAAGLPCIVTAAGAMGDVVRQANCGLVVTRDPESIASALRMVHSDPELAAQWGANARYYAEMNYSSEIVAASYVKAIASVL